MQENSHNIQTYRVWMLGEVINKKVPYNTTQRAHSAYLLHALTVLL